MTKSTDRYTGFTPRTAAQKAHAWREWHNRMAEAESKIPVAIGAGITMETVEELRQIRNRLCEIRHSYDAAADEACRNDPAYIEKMAQTTKILAGHAESSPPATR